MKSLNTWFEIPATDFSRAVQFYKELMNVNMQECDCGDEKMAFFPENKGAISYSKDFNPSNDGVLISFEVDDLDGAIAKTSEMKGKVVVDKTKIDAEKVRYFALILDSEGNRIGLHLK